MTDYRIFILLLSLPFLSNAQNNESFIKPVRKNVFRFIENKGQIIDQNNQPNPSVLYLLNTPGMNVQFKRGGFSYDLYTMSNNDQSILNDERNLNSLPYQASSIQHPAYAAQFPESDILYHRIDFNLIGFNPDYEIITSEPSADYMNYYTTGTPCNGVTSVHSYAFVTYKNIYPDIDITFMVDSTVGYKYNFIIHPGGKISSIKVQISGATEIQEMEGGLFIRTSIAEINEIIPYTYFLVNGSKTEIRSVFHKIKENLYGISVSRIVPKNAILTIDPIPRRLWGTYYGGDPSGSFTENDMTTSCTIDKDGNVLIAGYTTAINNIATSGSYQSVKHGLTDAYLAKFTPDGVRIWGTYYGGENWEYTRSCITDNANNIFLTGYTLSDSNIATPGSYQPVLFAGSDAFIAKFNQNGFRIWGTYYGGNFGDFGYSITLDPQCNIYVAGVTASTNNIASPGAFQESFGGGDDDAFLVRFDSTGQRIWGTYYGGLDFDRGLHCSVDFNGHLLLSGCTASTNNIASPGAHQTTFGGHETQGDGFVALFNPDGQRQWGTYYGGTGGDGISWCYTINAEKIYLFGSTFSTNNISTPSSYQPTFAGLVDSFIAKFSLTGVREWGTYHGAANYDGLLVADYDPRGALFFCGITNSVAGFATPDAFQSVFGGEFRDGFLAKFDTNGFRIWCTYYGGEEIDWAHACITDTNDRQYIIGHTRSDTGIASPGSHQEYHSGGWWDGFLAKLTDCTNPVPGHITGPTSVCLNSTGVLYSIPAIPKVTDYIWSPPPGTIIMAGQNTPAVTVDFPESSSSGLISVYAINHCGVGDTARMLIIPYPRPVPTITGNDSLCLGTSAVYSTQQGMTNYQWSVSPGGTIISGGSTSDSLVTILWDSIGMQLIQVNYTDTIGCTALNPGQFDVLVYPGPAITTDPLYKTICTGDSTRILLTATEPGTTFTWTAAGSSIYVSGYAGGSGETINQKLVNTGPAPETVTYSITPESGGCLGVTVDYIVTVNPIVPVSVSVVVSANPVCEGIQVIFTAIPTNGGNSPQFQWKVNGINVGTSSPVYACFPTNGDMVSCILTSSELCTSNNPASSNEIQMVVNPNFPVGVSIVANPNPFCPGIVVNYIATPVNGGNSPAYQWKINGNNAGTNSPDFSYSPQPGDSIWCIMTSNLDCVTSNPATSNKIAMLSAPFPQVIFTRCVDTITTLNAKPYKLKGGIPLGGTYTGPGVDQINGYFNPAMAGVGVHQITYTYTNFALCSDVGYLMLDVRSVSPFTCGDDLLDSRDSTTYPTVQIGTQCWMAANLDYGIEIPHTTSQRDNCLPEKYSRPSPLVPRPSFYQWDELMRYEETQQIQGLCPPGWHVPSEVDWNILFTNWTNNAFAGAPLKYSGYSGFNALLSGVEHFNRSWNFIDFAVMFWSSTSHGPWKAWAHGMNEQNYSVSYYPSYRANAFSVRCIKE